MSNDTDILLVDGPREGTIVCTPRPVTTNLVIPTFGGQDNYVTRKFWHPTHERWYWIAEYNGPVDDATVEAMITAGSHSPAWDLQGLAAPESET